MQIQKIQNNNTNFCANLKISNNCQTKIEKPVVEFLEKQFTLRTRNISGRLEVGVEEEAGATPGKELLRFCNGNGFDTIEIKFPFDEAKETLLDKLVNSLNGFLIREKAQNKIADLKTEIDQISDKAYSDSAKEFKKSFYVYENSLSTKDIEERRPAL